MPRFGSWHAIRQGLMEDNSNVTLKKSWPYLKKCFPYLLPYLKYVLLGSLFILLHTGAGLLRPVITMTIIDRVIPLGSDGIRLLNLLILGWLALALAENGIGVLQSYLFDYTNQSVFHDIRTKMFNHIQKLPVKYFEDNQTGNIMSRIINDVGALSGVFGTTFTDFTINALKIIGVAIFMFYYHPTLALISLLVAPFFALSFLLFKDKMKRIQKLTQDKWAEMSGTLQERLAGIRLVKAFVQEKYEEKKFKQSSNEVAEYQIKRQIIRSVGGMITGIIGVMGPLLITWYGVMEIIRGNLTLGQYFAFSQWTMHLLGPSRAIIMLLFGIQFSLGAAERVFDVLETPTEDQDKKDLTSLPPVLKGSIKLDNVVFAYNEQTQVLKGISMEVPPANVIALVGLSGAGKSTIAKLLLRFYPLSSGKIFIDNQDISKVDLNNLRRNIGFIDQDTFLFDSTIKENIIYGKPEATETEIIKAAKAANAHNFITELPNGYETLIGERGVKLSGGQKQRISVARTFLKDPKILILDEATSSLDSESEAAIHEALDELMQGRTTIIISHRLATLQKANQIYVLDQGKIAEQGTHLELIQNEQGLYKHLFELQYLKNGNDQVEETTEKIDKTNEFNSWLKKHPEIAKRLNQRPNLINHLQENPGLAEKFMANPQNGREILKEFMDNN